MKKYLGIVVLAAGTPFFALAQESVDFDYVDSLIRSAEVVIEMLLPVVATLALLFFFWGIAVFILNAGDPEARSRGIHHMVSGIVALFVLVAVWGLVGLLASIFNVETGGSAVVPGVGDVDDAEVLEYD